MKKISFSKPQVHLFVCINNRSSVGSNSCAHGVDASLVHELKQWVLSKGWANAVYVTKTHCLGFCHAQGGVAVVYPSGRFFKEIRNVEDLKEIIKSELNY